MLCASLSGRTCTHAARDPSDGRPLWRVGWQVVRALNAPATGRPGQVSSSFQARRPSPSGSATSHPLTWVQDCACCFVVVPVSGRTCTRQGNPQTAAPGGGGVGDGGCRCVLWCFEPPRPGQQLPSSAVTPGPATRPCHQAHTARCVGPRVRLSRLHPACRSNCELRKASLPVSQLGMMKIIRYELRASTRAVWLHERGSQPAVPVAPALA